MPRELAVLEDGARRAHRVAPNVLEFVHLLVSARVLAVDELKHRFQHLGCVGHVSDLKSIILAEQRLQRRA